MVAVVTPDRFRVRGAFTEVDRLVALHRCTRGLKLGGGRRRAAPLAGEWKTRRRGRGIDFEEVRLYQPGDDIRAIDWRVTARSQHPHTKVYREERERPIMLAADLRSPMFFGSRCFKSVYAASLMSALAWVALGNRDRVGGIAFGDSDHRDIRPRRSKHAVLEWIRQLDRYSRKLQSPCPGTPPQPLNRLLEQLIHTCRPGTAIYLVSDFHDLDAASQQRLHQLSRHNELTLCLLADPLEQGTAGEEGLWISDGRHRQPLQSTAPLAAALQARYRQLQQGCAPLGAAAHLFDTGAPLSQPLSVLCSGGKPW
ncbi:DUF58 domain-containing protein [Motiliproteus sp. SC1-56]|uniref:DUF58 domain-containing protein n=1 Tax=Motiliproteus sp. SC1-56 TaxID=2799565 RepID=UPI001A8DD97B|nr:DUF58 domain-containing protein [Motiliproteus sp. SC1-56]